MAIEIISKASISLTTEDGHKRIEILAKGQPQIDKLNEILSVKDTPLKGYTDYFDFHKISYKVF